MDKTVYKTGKHMYAVDAYVSLAKCYRVEAESKDEAMKKVEQIVLDLVSRPEAEANVALVEAGFNALGEIEEMYVSGEETVDGEIGYY